MDGTTKANVIIGIVSACAPILIALIGIIPTIISNRKKTEQSIDEMRKKTDESFTQFKADMKACQTGLVDDIKKSNEELREEIKRNNEELRAELRSDTEETNAKVDALSEQFRDHMRENEDDNAKQARARILDFYDDICEGKRHSETHFEDILDDIDFYEEYTENHKDFKNSRGHAAMNYIRAIYSKVKDKGGFLVHSSDD